jgi:hypothetical protein
MIKCSFRLPSSHVASEVLPGGSLLDAGTLSSSENDVFFSVRSGYTTFFCRLDRVSLHQTALGLLCTAQLSFYHWLESWNRCWTSSDILATCGLPHRRQNTTFSDLYYFFTYTDVSKHILVVDISVLTKSNMGWRE